MASIDQRRGPRDRPPHRPLRRDAQVNRDRLLTAAVAAMLRDGRQVPMSTIAADAGVGIATLYRRYPSREALLDALTCRSFKLLVDVSQQAEAKHDNAIACLSWWWDRVIDLRGELMLPLGGGPPVSDTETFSLRSQLHASLHRVLVQGQLQGSIRDDVGVGDLIIFGAMLVTPPPGTQDWDGTARRQKEIYLDGLGNSRRTRLSG